MKILYYLLEDNGDLSVTCTNLQECQDIIDSSLTGLTPEQQKELFFTITPKYYSQWQYKRLGEWQG